MMICRGVIYPTNCSKMFTVHGLTGKQRLILGLVVLFLVDIIWVGSAELTEYIFKEEKYSKPYFTTYIKTAMFGVYLLGFLFRKSWRRQCRWPKNSETILPTDSYLSEPVYIPLRDNDDGYNSIDSSDAEVPCDSPARKAVRFRDQMEVRVMTNHNAHEAKMARLSYNEYTRKRAEEARLHKKFPVPTICKLALIFCVIWFVASFSYQEALSKTQSGIVNVLSSTSGLFTLVLAAVWSSGPMDRFTLSKFLAVLLSLGGTTMVCLSDAQSVELTFPVGTIWALLSALAYAVYLVTLKRKVPDDEQLDIPMFFGLLLMHFTSWEPFRLPNQHELLLLVINGLIGTVLSELLWLWGCFLTSSLIGTLALSLTTPLTMLFDVFIKKVSYHWMFYVGVAPVFVSFLAVTALSHYDNWDPALILIKKCTKCFSRTMQAARLREMESDQTEHLLSRDSA